MDAASMIMGGAIASIAWIAFIPAIRRSGARTSGSDSCGGDAPTHGAT
ncbi:hypothetical protein [Microbacterium sp. MPKO10]|nr:hypothetical protein [Microbacterium sp. MPKO10]MCW4457048.1 hypothetical protein [Microbacterium sp. MPKO10]